MSHTRKNFCFGVDEYQYTIFESGFKDDDKHIIILDDAHGDLRADYMNLDEFLKSVHDHFPRTKEYTREVIENHLKQTA